MWDIEDGTALVTNHRKAESDEDNKSDNNNDVKELNVNIANTQSAETKTQEPIITQDSNAEPTIIEKTEDKERK